MTILACNIPEPDTNGLNDILGKLKNNLLANIYWHCKQQQKSGQQSGSESKPPHSSAISANFLLSNSPALYLVYRYIVDSTHDTHLLISEAAAAAHCPP